MADDGESRIDPRYHPAFQRGFQPKPVPERVRGREFQPTIAQGAADPRAADHRRDATSVPDSSIGIAPAIGSVEIIAEAEVELTDRRVRRVNPYYRGLLIAGILSIFASAALYWTGTVTSMVAVDTESSSWLQAVRLVGYVFEAPLVTVGLAIIVGLVFVRANALGKGRV
jgi:hypothetical protein